MEVKNTEYKYVCEKCDFRTNAKSLWDKHLITGKHISGERAPRCDKKLPDKCPHCDYKPKSNINMKQHLLSAHSSNEEKEKEYKYYCNHCDFGSFAQQTYETHLQTDKHKQMIKMLNKVVNKAVNSK